MMDIDNISWIALSDTAIAERLGAFVKQVRLDQNKTQNKLAEEAGIHRSTLVALEKGNPSNIMTLIRLLRVLNQLHVLERFYVTKKISPIQLAELDQLRRKRASKAKKRLGKKKSGW